MSTDPTPFPTATQASPVTQTRVWIAGIKAHSLDIRKNTLNEHPAGDPLPIAAARKSHDLRMAALKLDEAVLHLEAELERIRDRDPQPC